MPVDSLFRKIEAFQPGVYAQYEEDDIHYAADKTPIDMDAVVAKHGRKSLRCGTVSSIHMPRWASRITLRITGVRVERVQEITEEQAIAEGAEKNAANPANWLPEFGYRPHCVHYPDGCDCHPLPTARDYFASLWAKINGAESWNANVWVWCVSFERVEAR
jgi:hypothetical protein